MEATKLGKYEIRAMIGRGAAGVVYEAWDPMMARTVAIKALPLLDLDEEGKEHYARFKREAQAAARLHHPNIVSAFDYGETDASAYIVMEFLPGPSLKSLLAKHEPLPLDRIGTIMHGLLKGLQHSHARGVVHRDIKPANIVFAADGEVKITDFGIAHLDTSGMTQAGSVLGTPAYMAPEQVMGDPVDARTDLFSVGVLLYEMLTGRRPFEGSTSSIMHKIVHLHPPRPSDLAATVSAAFDAVLAKALAKNADERYQTAAEFDAALSAALTHTPQSAPSVGLAREPETTLLVHEPPARGTLRAEPLQSRTTPRPAKPSAAAGRGQWRWLLAGTGVLGFAAIAWLALVPFAGRSPSDVQSPANADSADSATAPPSLTGAASGSQQQATSSTPPANQATSPATAAGAAASGTGSKLPDAAAAARPAPQPVANPLQPLREEMQAIVASAPCSLVTAEVAAPDKVRLRGVSALGEASEVEVQASLQRAIRATAPDAAISWSMQRIDGPYCPVLDTLRSMPNGSLGFGVALSLPGDRTHLTEADSVHVAAAMPSHPAQLALDLFTADGQVHHLHAGPIDAAHPEAALTLRPGKPYGDQLLSAVIASGGLPGAGRPKQESATDYLKELRSALSRTDAHDMRLATDVLPIVVTAR